MKKFLVIFLSILLLVTLFTGCGKETDSTESHDHDHGQENQPTQTVAPSSSAAPEDHDHNHINYKGLSTKSYALEDVTAAEGAEPAFSFDTNNITYYVYKDVALEELRFSQVQHSFMGDYNRVSCTSSDSGDPAAVLADWEQAMTALYGQPSVSDNNLLRWSDHTGNYVTLTQLNETTVQLCYYFVA